MDQRFAVLSVEDMYGADRLAMAAGIGGPRLMEAAGWAVARALWMRFKPCRVAVLCGPGNNGGDGFVAARYLRRRGYAVRLGLMGTASALKGDAALMAGRWRGDVEPLSLDVLNRADVVVDALFGAGLARPVDGMAARLVAEIKRRNLPVVAVDVPSGVHGDSGQVLGDAVSAAVTVTFFRKKPAHLLLPGRTLCGMVEVADIGIPASVLDRITPICYENDPSLWGQLLPRLQAHHHKYHRGHALMVAGPEMTGAIRLAAMAARRAGAGLVTVAAPDGVLSILRAAEAGTIVVPLARFQDLWADPRHTVLLVGPGAGRGEDVRSLVAQALSARKPMVLDADALTAFADHLDELFRLTNENVLMTPHEGEFRRLFGDEATDKLTKARQAAALSKAVIVLKGADTVIAHPDGRAIVNGNAPPWLATAGSGDVLAGLATGLMAQGLDAFTAAATAVWWHGAAAHHAGPGLVAEDLATNIAATSPFVTKQ